MLVVEKPWKSDNARLTKVRVGLNKFGKVWLANFGKG